jgi:hypothetical protein
MLMRPSKPHATCVPQSPEILPAFCRMPGACLGGRACQDGQFILAQGWASKCVLAATTGPRGGSGARWGADRWKLANLSQALQRLAEGLLGLILIKDENHLLEARIPTLDVFHDG